MRRWACAAVMVWSVGLPAPAFAQETIQEILSFLLTNQSVITDDVRQDADAAAATRDTIARALLIELAALPLGSSSAGLTYRLNPVLGTVERASDSFGLFFAERASTTGAGHGSVGVTFRHASFDTLDGKALRDGTLVTTANRFSDETTPFDEETLTLRLRSSATIFFGTYGITPHLDLGVAVPIAEVRLDGERVGTYRGRTFLQAEASAFARGLGDVGLRAKYQLLRHGATAVAVATDIRLPTGNAENLLGAGEPAMKLLGIGSFERGLLGTHWNVGYAVGGAAREASFASAITLAASPRVTLIGELLGRRIGGLGTITEVAEGHPRLVDVQTIRLVPDGTASYQTFAVGGLKWNVGGHWLLTANVLMPLTSSGLTARAIPAIALEYAR